MLVWADEDEDCGGVGEQKFQVRVNEECRDVLKENVSSVSVGTASAKVLGSGFDALTPMMTTWF